MDPTSRLLFQGSAGQSTDIILPTGYGEIYRTSTTAQNEIETSVGDPFGNLIISFRNYVSTNEFFVIKLSPANVVLWVKKINSSTALYLAVGASGEIYFAGSNNVIGKMDASGNMLWSKSITISGSSYIQIYAIAVAPDGGAYVTGASQLGPIIGKLNSSGNAEGVRRFLSTSQELFYRLRLDSSGKLIIFYSYNNIQRFYKYDWEGNYFHWGYGVNRSFISSFAVSKGTNSIYFGTFETTSVYRIIKLNANGGFEWGRFIGTSQNAADPLTGFTCDDDGNVYALTQSSSSTWNAPELNAGTSSLFVTKLSSNGDLIYQRGIGYDYNGSYYKNLSFSNHPGDVHSGSLRINGRVQWSPNYNVAFYAQFPVDGTLTSSSKECNYVVATRNVGTTSQAYNSTSAPNYSVSYSVSDAGITAVSASIQHTFTPFN